MALTSASPFVNRLSNSTTITLAALNSKIREAVNQRNPETALCLFRQLIQNGVKPNNFTFPFVAKACAKLSNLKYSQIIHAHVVKSPFVYDLYVQTSLVDMYVKCNEVESAFKVFEGMSERDLACWNAMIVGYGQLGFVDRMFRLFRDMVVYGVRADVVTVMGLTQGCVYKRDLRMLKGVHSYGICNGMTANVSVGNTWIAAYAKCGDLESAVKVFSEIVFDLRTVVSWNSMIAGYAEFGRYTSALQSYKSMLSAGFMPDVSTIVSLLSSFVEAEALVQGMLLHSHAIQLGYDSGTAVSNTLISMYCKCGDIESARVLFDAMPGRTCISWTAMIGGYAEKGNMDEALKLFTGMREAGEKPDLVTVVSLISGCGMTGALELGKWFDQYASQIGLKESARVCNALIDMYSKCGSINDARELFYAMPERTVVSWTAMIAGCALNGEFLEALQIFFQMVDSGVKPNHITFLAVLQACTHGGLLDRGWECFDMMSKRYSITPGLDHYACMADLLGRKGKIKEALDFIQNMPMKPDAAIWSTLLSACKIHNNIKVGEYVTHCLLEREPLVAVPYVEMANIYASSGKWDGVAKIRTMMKDNKVKKSPGQSLIQVNGETRAFTVEDRGHSDGEVIYELLDVLMLQAKDEGFSPELLDVFYR